MAQALYVHIPFCLSKCDYCDFYSEIIDPNRARQTVDAMLAELNDENSRVRPSFETVFIGGGTPTSLPTPLLGRALSTIKPLIADLDTCEFTCEANPATVTPEIARCLKTNGVNRVSLGAQSFDPQELAILGRKHEPSDVAKTLETCRQQDIRRLSLDLIFGIPDQTLDSWRNSLRQAIDLGVEHLSCYGLTFEADTRLEMRHQSGQIEPVDNSLEADMYELAIDELASVGLEQYEISNFARPGCECRHNLVYWHNEPYLGIGPAAAGYVDGLRYKNVENISEYVSAIQANRSPRCEEEQLDNEHAMGETAMLGLRLRSGLSRQRFIKKHGVDPVTHFQSVVEKHLQAGFLEVDDLAIRLTRAGLLVADSVISDFID